MKIAILAAALTLAAPARALDPWAHGDTRREAAFLALGLTDIGLTSYMLRQDGFAERNPVLGRHPSQARLWGLGLSALASHALVARLLPARAREAWQVGGIAIEAIVTAGNVGLAVGGAF